MALKSFFALSKHGSSIPDLDCAIWRSTHKFLARYVVAEGPDSLLVALESLLALIVGSIPHLDGLIVTGAREFFLAGWINAKSIHRIVVF